MSEPSLQSLMSEHEQERIGFAIQVLHGARPDLTTAQCADVVHSNIAEGNYLLPSTPEAVEPPEAAPGEQTALWPGVPGWRGATLNGPNGEGR